MKLSQIVSGLLTATIVLAVSACGSQTDSTSSDQIPYKEASRITSVPVPSEQVTSKEVSRVAPVSTPSTQVATKDTNQVVAVQAGSQPAWGNEGDQSKELLVTLRSSQALMKEGESAMLKASANNVSGKPLSVNMVLQLGNGLILSSATSCTGDPCTGQFDIPAGKQALMSVLVQSSGPVAKSYSVILHYNYPDPETRTTVKGRVEGLIGSAEHVVARVPDTNIPAPPEIAVPTPMSIPGSTPIQTPPSNPAPGTIPTQSTLTTKVTSKPQIPTPTSRPVAIPVPVPTPTSKPLPTPTPLPANALMSANPMSQPRMDFRAIRLSDGKVLVAGGWTSPGTSPLRLSSSEIFDPVDGTWTAAGDMFTARANFTMTLLMDGRVLVTGGHTCKNTAEVYDPTSNKWESVGEMTLSRTFHTATLLANGQVLLVGGYAWESPQGGRDKCVLSEVGWIEHRDSAEVYDPTTETFYPAGNLNHLRVHHSASLLSSGKVLVVGGLDDNAYLSAEVFDPQTGIFSLTGPLVHGRRNTDSTLLHDGTLLVRGGYGDQTSNSAELFDPTSNSWSPVSGGLAVRYNHAAILLTNGKVLITGGTSGFDMLNSVELYDPATKGFPGAPYMDQPRSGHAIVELSDGRIAIIGGYGNNRGLSSMEVYYP